MDLAKTETCNLPFEDSGESGCPAANSENFCCLVGPCKHYSDVVFLTDTCFRRTRRLFRFCRHFLEEGGDHMQLGEYAIEACTAYSPPWWSPAGWKRRVSNYKLMLWAYGKKSPDVRFQVKSLALQIYLWIAAKFSKEEVKVNG